jgi:hypothetical protein
MNAELCSHPQAATVLTFAPPLITGIALLFIDIERYSIGALALLVLTLLSIPAFHKILSNKTVSLPIYYFTIEADQPPFDKIGGCVLLAAPLYMILFVIFLKWM